MTFFSINKNPFWENRTLNSSVAKNEIALSSEEAVVLYNFLIDNGAHTDGILTILSINWLSQKKSISVSSTITKLT